MPTLLVDPDSAAGGQRVFDVKVGDGAVEQVDVFERAGGAGRMVALDYTTTLKTAGTIDVTVTPVKGKAILCGAIVSQLH